MGRAFGLARTRHGSPAQPPVGQLIVAAPEGTRNVGNHLRPGPTV
jgi:hypothetical protein